MLDIGGGNSKETVRAVDQETEVHQSDTLELVKDTSAEVTLDTPKVTTDSVTHEQKSKVEDNIEVNIALETSGEVKQIEVPSNQTLEADAVEVTLPIVTSENVGQNEVTTPSLDVDFEISLSDLNSPSNDIDVDISGMVSTTLEDEDISDL